MKVLIVCLMLVFIGLHLAKKDESNNFFALLCGFVITATIWAFAQSWAWQVAALVVTVLIILWIRVYKPMRSFNDLDSSTFVQLYEKHLSKTYDLYDLYDPYVDYYREKIKRFGDIIRMLRIAMIIIISRVLLIYCFQLSIGEIWWKWIIPSPVELLCFGWIINTIKNFLDKI